MSKGALWAAALLAAVTVAVPGVVLGDVEAKVALGTTSLRDTSETGTVVRIRVTTERGDRACGACAGYWGTDEGEEQPPRLVVASLDIVVGRDTVLVPPSAVAGLADPSTLRLSVGGRGATIEMQGGDAAGSWDGSWVVIDGMLYKRRVSSGEFPDEAWEETVYSWIPADTDDR
jgi:hypothetical protein